MSAESDFPWPVLGLAPTEDERAIRRAYADRLRAMDPDADPDAYVRLRAARDVALARARAGTALDRPEDAAQDGGGGRDEDALEDWDDPDLWDEGAAVTFSGPDMDRLLRPGFPPSLWTAPATPLSRPSSTDPETAALDERWSRLGALLRDTDAALTGDELREANAALDVLLADPRLEQIGFLAAASDSFAWLLADTAPRSDPLLERVADAFDWGAQAGRRDENPAVMAVNQRLTTLALLEHLERPDHYLHRAWKELSRPASAPRTARGRFVSKRRMRELLIRIRHEAPNVEWRLDPKQVARWDRRTTRGGPRYWLLILMLAIIAPRLIWGMLNGGDDPAPTPAPAPQPLTTLAQDVAPILESVAPVSHDDLRRDNPALAERIEAQWRDTAAREGTDVALRQAVSPILEHALRMGLAHAGPPLLEAEARWRVDAARWWRETDIEQCAAFSQGLWGFGRLPEELRERYRRIAADLLRTPGEDIAPQGFSFMIPVSIPNAIVERTGIPRQRVLAALTDNAPAEDICNVRIALNEEVLRAPEPERASILRAMAGGG